jgi:hypothetical protein
MKTNIYNKIYNKNHKLIKVKNMFNNNKEEINKKNY